jgi:4-diphosphocytidyl-2-C-methyl-D-erythritol kinase
MELQVQAYGKLNLSLDVVEKLPTGYHAMKMVMETVAYCDDVYLSLGAGAGVKLATNLPYLPADSRNIAVQAAQVFFRELELAPREVTIRIHKRLPVSAGMAGGSSNAAAVLRGLNTLLGTGLDSAQLRRIGLLLGSDVPYCVVHGTALAAGRGELLTPLRPLPPCHIVGAKPKFSINTPSLFARIDCSKIRHRPDTAGIQAALVAQDLGQVARCMYNVFEDVLDERGREVANIKRTLLDSGALGAAMTGTGPLVFGLFDDAELARAAAERLAKMYPETFLTKNRGPV